ncbi:urease accessory protein UreF [Mycobacteroides immunogenum]|uniref:Urease accessory protein UreF n=1 Tax=Mycobacteroides immunogenum TaxID=83262 RepID=A0A7V8LME2_9MYCO|nr:urease accessory UreF family protein [Mycobacteroides immunogenum]AMT71073.1 urease accessory protein UreF [Mycobacteroides immunogenum]ANO04179.1 urease accessory protein UreF [Mycobacteroides immunogenum]KIU39114.1 urease accessory protein UreF [Mycobacteroides immunogenum]KPG04963.1 urease accessory protein UreF [Mycobacteroides immunogenum]KPG06784.1 urease accessory protein UreF [Mycobacteroides immunogenum]
MDLANTSATTALLLSLADSRLPTGSHVHSGGVEEAIAQGLVWDRSTLMAYLRRRIRTHGLVAGSIAAAISTGRLDPVRADAETDARTPSRAARDASRAQGRGLRRLASIAWPHIDWSPHGRQPHLAVVYGIIGAATGLTGRDIALVVVYTTLTGSATAGQRLLALDPAEVAVGTLELTGLCEQTATLADTELASLSDPLLDVLAEQHLMRERPLFVS